MKRDKTLISRRALGQMAAGFGATRLAGAAVGQSGSSSAPADAAFQQDLQSTSPQGTGIKRRVSGYQSRNWQDHFQTLSGGVILVDTYARALHFWDETDTIYKIYPTSVPLTEDLTRRGRTSIVRIRVGPDWRPTPSMLRREPSLPPYVGPGPQNPLGTHALYLTWTYYRIHGTNDVRKIGRRSSNGCIGLYNNQIEELFDMCVVGTQVFVI